MSELGQTPNANRIHIGFFGKTNSGKSSLINAITKQSVSLVSNIKGTTTDPVYKNIELNPLGPCVLIDTGGFDDYSTLGIERIKKTEKIIEETDIAVFVISNEERDFDLIKTWLEKLKTKPVIIVINKIDLNAKDIPLEFNYPIVKVSARDNIGIDDLKAEIVKCVPSTFEISSLTSHLVSKKDHVLLVAPQDIQAPKGRLILPQVQTIRDLLDNHCIVTVVTKDELEEALGMFKMPPKLIITDSQEFMYVYKRCPENSMLTSFSVLMARQKGDVLEYIAGAKAIDTLKPQDKVLILEACTHNPLDGDIGRIKIPALLRKKVGEELTIDVVSGKELPSNLNQYGLVVHCGGCMFNRSFLLARIQKCIDAGVPITNYGILIAKIGGILDKITVK